MLRSCFCPPAVNQTERLIVMESRLGPEPRARKSHLALLSRAYRTSLLEYKAFLDVTSTSEYDRSRTIETVELSEHLSDAVDIPIKPESSPPAASVVSMIQTTNATERTKQQRERTRSRKSHASQVKRLQHGLKQMNLSMDDHHRVIQDLEHQVADMRNDVKCMLTQAMSEADAVSSCDIGAARSTPTDAIRPRSPLA